MNIITGEAHHYTNIYTEQKVTLPSPPIQYIYLYNYYFIIILLPFEPTLFPKLQVYFADFPYLRYAIKTPDASNIEDLMRLSVRNGLKMNFKHNTLFFTEQ